MRLIIALTAWTLLVTIGDEHMKNVAVPWIMLYGVASWFVAKVVAVLMTLPPQRRAP